MNNDSIAELTIRLQRALDSNYDVIDMQTVLFVISQLEGTTITKEQLETTRLAKYINQLRRRTSSEQLARRAKSLLKKWREMVIPTITQQSQLQQRQPTPPTHPEILAASTISHSLHVSVSQPTSPAVQLRSESQPLHIYPGGSKHENISLPEYPCASSTSKNVSNKKSNQTLLSNGGGGQHRNINTTEQVAGSHKLFVSKANISRSSQVRKQPISFANLIESTNPNRIDNAGPSFLNEENRSLSPILSLPRIPKIQHDRQSPMIIEHSVSPLELDQNSNPSREGSLVPPTSMSGPSSLAVMNNNNTISSCSRLTNGDYGTTSIDIHDTNSNSNLGSNIDTMVEVQRLLESRSSEHRKSKKHKKEKKRSRQQKFQENAPSVLPLGARRDNPCSVEPVPVLSDETQICGANIFPTQENLSLSNSSLSMFPNTNTNTNIIENNRGNLNTIQKAESDLTFAGKFKNTNSNTVTSAGVGLPQVVMPAASEQVSSVDNAYLTVITPIKKSVRQKESSSVVVIESRSCSPFLPIGGNSNDSSSASSSSRASNRRLVDVPNQDSQGGMDQIRLQPLILKQDQLLSLKPPECDQLKQETEEMKMPKKRGRKKGSKGADAMMAHTQIFESSRLLSVASLSGSKKVKTTKELLADIQSRKLESTTSSPTLQSQSRPPSTCSEPSLQSPNTSDACSTNATMSTVARSTPDQHIITTSNIRMLDGNDEDSATDSSSTLKKPSQTFDDETKSFKSEPEARKAESIEEEIKKLLSQLPPVDRTQINWDLFEEPLCTCTVQEVKQINVQLPVKEESHDVKKIIETAPVQIKQPEKPLRIPIKKVSPIRPKASEKPVKSIFDLDYDEENDPLHSFVEAAKTSAMDTTESDVSVEVTVKSPKKEEPEEIPAVPTPVPHQHVEFRIQNAPAISFATSCNEVQPVPSFPVYEVVEDPNCLAKQRYEVQINRITKFHIDSLHNRFIPNVNGNWDHSVAKNLDDDGQTILSFDEMTPDGLYIRIAPQYNHLIMDRIPKDLSHVQFTKHYKAKRSNWEMKRKRSNSSSSAAADEIQQRKKSPTIVPNNGDALSMKADNDNDFAGTAILSNVENGLITDINTNLESRTCPESVDMDSSRPIIELEKSKQEQMDVGCYHEATTLGDVDVSSPTERTIESDTTAVSGNGENVPPSGITSINSSHNSNGSRRSSSCSNSSSNPTNVLNSSNNNDVSNNIEDNDDNSVDHEEHSYGHSNGSEDREADEEYPEDDEDYDDYDEDEEGAGDFHEVVTHDMPSSTSGHKPIVLTIKKTPSKHTPQSSPSLPLSSSAEVGTSKKRKLLASDNAPINNSNIGENLIDNNENEMAVASDDVSFSDNENLNKFDTSSSNVFERNEPCALTVKDIPKDSLTLGRDDKIQTDVSVIGDHRVNEKTADDVGNDNPFSSSPTSIEKADEFPALELKSSTQLERPPSESNCLKSESDEESLEDENNTLLKSFNNLTEENRTGLRVDSNGKVQQFKEWHEVLQVRSYNDELLTILPYVVID